MKRLFTAIILITASVTCFGQYPGSKYYPRVEGDDVTFNLIAPHASSVKVYGDFLPGVNEYNLGGNVEMSKDTEGCWSYTAKDLAPDFYFYYFEVDGVKVLDPHNLKVVPDGGDPL